MSSYSQDLEIWWEGSDEAIIGTPPPPPNVQARVELGGLDDMAHWPQFEHH